MKRVNRMSVVNVVVPEILIFAMFVVVQVFLKESVTVMDQYMIAQKNAVVVLN